MRNEPITRIASLRTDAQGTVQQSFGFGAFHLRGNRFPATGRRSLDQGCRRRIEKARALRNDFDALAIIAPPKSLGFLKKCLHKEVEKRIVCTVNKEMSGRPIPDIEALLNSHMAAEELPAV